MLIKKVGHVKSEWFPCILVNLSTRVIHSYNFFFVFLSNYKLVNHLIQLNQTAIIKFFCSRYQEQTKLNIVWESCSGSKLAVPPLHHSSTACRATPQGCVFKCTCHTACCQSMTHLFIKNADEALWSQTPGPGEPLRRCSLLWQCHCLCSICSYHSIHMHAVCKLASHDRNRFPSSLYRDKDHSEIKSTLRNTTWIKFSSPLGYCSKDEQNLGCNLNRNIHS